jgi:hypothetical protein
MSKYILTDTLYYRSIMIGYIYRIEEMYWLRYIDVQGMTFADICLEVSIVLNEDRKGM